MSYEYHLTSTDHVLYHQPTFAVIVITWDWWKNHRLRMTLRKDHTNGSRRRNNRMMISYSPYPALLLYMSKWVYVYYNYLAIRIVEDEVERQYVSSIEPYCSNLWNSKRQNISHNKKDISNTKVMRSDGGSKSFSILIVSRRYDVHQ